MNFRKIFYRLDVRLSAAIAGVFVLWFTTIIVALAVVQSQKNDQNFVLEQNKVIARLQKEKSLLLNDIILAHDQGIQLALQKILTDTGVVRVDLKTSRDAHFAAGSAPVNFQGGEEVVPLKYAIDFDGKSYGALEVTMRKPLTPPISIFAFVLCLASGIVMIIVFFMVRRFFSQQVIKPIGMLISNFAQEKEGDQKSGVQASSYELEQLHGLLTRMRSTNDELQRTTIQQEKKVLLGNLATQVAHDIRSPLTSLLDVVKSAHKHLPLEESSLLRSSASRIEKICQDLIEKYRDPDQARNSFTLPAGLISSIILEKNVILKNQPHVQIKETLDQNAVGFAVGVSESDLSRVLSNLLSNAIDATRDQDSGVISVRLELDEGRVRILVVDNGKGIPEDVLEKLRSEGGSFGKSSGLGIGLQHARRIAKAAGGRLNINSKLGVGTTVGLTLPIVITPAWFAKELEISPAEQVVVLDDDESVHLLWKQRLKGKNVVYLSNPKDFDLKLYPPETSRYIFDLEIIGCTITGLDLIKSLKIGTKATLVTSYHDDPKVQSEIALAGATLLPKFMIPYVPIVEPVQLTSATASDTITNPDLVLIDDGPLNHAIWSSRARSLGLRILILEKEMDLSPFSVRLDTPIYVDNRLADEVSGIDVARRMHGLGFKTIKLATADGIAHDESLSFLSGIIGKSFPVEDFPRKAN